MAGANVALGQKSEPARQRRPYLADLQPLALQPVQVDVAKPRRMPWHFEQGQI